jgi:hypothetical protein
LATEDLSGPTYNDLRWQAFSSLAYGVTGFQYYVYNTDNPMFVGAVDTEGNKTQDYYDIQKLNTELRNFEKVFMDYSWKGTMNYVPKNYSSNQIQQTLNKLASPLKKTSRIKAYSADQAMLIGAFKNNKNHYNQDAFMISNYDQSNLNRENNVSITFNRAKRAMVFVNGERTIMELPKSGNLKITLDPGEGAFVIPMTE